MIFHIRSTGGKSPGDHWHGIVWCSAIQVTWVRLKNKVTTAAAWCPVSSSEFLQKGVFI